MTAPQSPNLAAGHSRPGLGGSSETVAALRATSAQQATEGDPRRLLETDTGRAPLRLEDEQRPKGAGPAEHRSGPIRPEEHIRRRSNQEERAAGPAVVALTAATLVAVGLCRVFARRRPRLGNAGPARRRRMREWLISGGTPASQRAGAAAPCRRAGGNTRLLGLRRRRGVRGRAAFRLRVTAGGAARAVRARRAAAEATDRATRETTPPTRARNSLDATKPAGDAMVWRGAAPLGKHKATLARGGGNGLRKRTDGHSVSAPDPAPLHRPLQDCCPKTPISQLCLLFTLGRLWAGRPRRRVRTGKAKNPGPGNEGRGPDYCQEWDGGPGACRAGHWRGSKQPEQARRGPH